MLMCLEFSRRSKSVNKQSHLSVLPLSEIACSIYATQGDLLYIGLSLLITSNEH